METKTIPDNIKKLAEAQTAGKHIQIMGIRDGQWHDLKWGEEWYNLIEHWTNFKKSNPEYRIKGE